MEDKIIDENLSKVIELCYEMLELADHGDKFRLDSGCGVVYGTLRDEAYKIRRLAEKELLEHGRRSGKDSRRIEEGLKEGDSRKRRIGHDSTDGERPSV